MWTHLVSRLAGMASARRSTAFRVFFVLLAFVLSYACRAVLDGYLPPGFPYLTFFPAVVVTAFIAGTWAGIVLGVLCGLASWYSFIAPMGSFALDTTSALALSLYAFVVITDIALIHAMTRALERLDAERERSARLARSRELMFSELQHRVSNNLQVVASLLNAQRRGVSDPAAQAALDAAAGRLSVVARVQRRLHDSTRQDSDIRALLADVLPEVLNAGWVTEQVDLNIDAEPALVNPEQALTAMLVVTELVANSIEHGGAGRPRIAIAIRSRLDGDTHVIEVSDDGPGYPDGFDLSSVRSLGMSIARQLVRQLGGTLEITAGAGASTRLTFPLDATTEARDRDEEPRGAVRATGSVGQAV